MGLIKKLLPVVNNSGFYSDEYSIWGGCVIKGTDDKYYMFAGATKTFFDNHMDSAEIIMGVTDSLDTPFTYVKTVIGHRDSSFWDGETSYNPSIIKFNDKYYILYSGKDGSIGYAYTDDLNSDFIRCDSPISLPTKAYNASAVIDYYGLIRLYYRDENKKVYLAEANTFENNFSVLRKDLFPLGRIEDISTLKVDFGYNIIALDAEGMYCGKKNAGTLFRSADGLYWHPATPALAYSFNVETKEGAVMNFERREHPSLFFDNGHHYLITAVQEGTKVYNLIQPLSV